MSTLVCTEDLVSPDAVTVNFYNLGHLHIKIFTNGVRERRDPSNVEKFNHRFK